MTILVFDSGVGGLSVLREARVLMPEHRFVYVGDDAAFPYGDWEEAALIDRLLTSDHPGALGTLHEIHEPMRPFTPRGCPAQAWSVAEVLRVLTLASS